MRYQTPQFIDIKAKIVGPLTLKQFLYLAFGGGILIFLFVVFKFFVFLVLGIPVAALSAALAFLTVNGQPFDRLLVKGIKFLFKPKKYVWKK